MKTLSFRLEGITPLLMNNVTSMLTAKEKPSRTPYDEWEAGSTMFEARQYRTCDKTKLILPERMLRGLLVNGAKKSGIKQTGKRSTYADLVQSTLFFEDVILEQPVASLIREQSFVGMNGTKKVLRVWPKLEQWSGIVKVVIADPGQFKPDILAEIFDYAGKFVGLGDYRPQFGRFTVKEIE